MTDQTLYLITPPQIEDLGSFAEVLSRALDAGDGAVACLQLRLKDVSDDEVLRAAETIAPILSAAGVGFLINDRADLAAKTGADGVHLGQSDGSVAEARTLLGADKDIGVTCHTASTSRWKQARRVRTMSPLAPSSRPRRKRSSITRHQSS